MATEKLCDSCKSAAPSMFCRADSAFLCVSCDARVHAANKLASRHARVWMCDVCEQAPAHVTCKADAASLCVSCDRDIHSANPLARRHERVPVVPFYDPVLSEEEDEAEAASWLLPAAAKPDPYACSFPNMVDPFLDLDYVDAKQEEEDASGDNNSSGTTDGVVPVQSQLIIPHHQLVTDHGSCFELDFSQLGESKPLPFPTYNFHSSTPCLSHSHSHSHSVSSSSMEVGVVPEGDIYSSGGQQVGTEQAKEAVALSGAEREARVLRYREKRKNRKFEKTIRYASRKAYAETRPRIKGRFAKRTDLDHDHDHLLDHRTHLFGFGVVPSY